MEQLIRQWAIDKELDKGHPYSQYIKMMEEQGELAEALVKKQSYDDIKDAIGDVFVTLVILAQQLDTSVAECSQIAYNVIKDRQGKMVDGTFIKEDDLGVGRMDNMQDRMFDKHGNCYRDLTARIDEDNETTWGDVIKSEPEDIMFDRYGILDRDPTLCIVEEDYYSVVDRMKDIYAAKNSDYGNSFEMTLDKYGIIGAIIRMQDKMNRIDGYYWKPDEDKKVDESLIDTLEDLGNYAIMTSVWLRNQ